MLARCCSRCRTAYPVGSHIDPLRDLKLCPVCGGWLTLANIKPGKTVYRLEEILDSKGAENVLYPDTR
jgi:rRNA maturation endonuclease Nob1